MRRLAATLTHLTFGMQQAVHRRHRAQIATFIQQVGIDAGRCLVDEALLVQHAEDLGAFVSTECARLRCTFASTPRPGRALAVTPIVACACAAERHARCAFAEDWGQITDRLIDHHFGSPPLVSAPPVASCSSSAESFPWISITVCALARSASRRTLSRRSLAISWSRGSLRGRPAGAANAWSAPSSRCLRHSEIIDEYSPSRRSSAPLAPLSQRSYSARILALYCAEKVRRLARSGTSGSPGSVTGQACRPAATLVTTIVNCSPYHALLPGVFRSRSASPNVDTEGGGRGDGRPYCRRFRAAKRTESTAVNSRRDIGDSRRRGTRPTRHRSLVDRRRSIWPH